MNGEELQELTTLVTSPGWLWLQNYVKDKHSLESYVSAAANDRDDVMALNKLRQVLAARQAVDALLSAPSERIKFLQAQRPAPAVFSRGGL